jgi:H+/Cl- antiporter ClcA
LIVTESKRSDGPATTNPLRWFPEFLELGRRRIRGQVRLMGLALLVGIVAGLGSIVFYVATQVVSHYALGVAVGYRPQPHPSGEPELGWLGAADQSFRPWLLLVIPAVGGIVSGFLVFTFAPEAEGAWHRRCDCRLSL